ncbi:MAG: hypothetical protein JWN25_2077 [Verrucomicrobiales bacterium]|nr:hypothetical protein [Verrucomicrobiales bacterium]
MGFSKALIADQDYSEKPALLRIGQRCSTNFARSRLRPSASDQVAGSSIAQIQRHKAGGRCICSLGKLWNPFRIPANNLRQAFGTALETWMQIQVKIVNSAVNGLLIFSGIGKKAIHELVNRLLEWITKSYARKAL